MLNNKHKIYMPLVNYSDIYGSLCKTTGIFNSVLGSLLRVRVGPAPPLGRRGTKTNLTLADWLGGGRSVSLLYPGDASNLKKRILQ